MKIALFIIGIVLIVFGNRPSVVKAISPANLVSCVIGGGLVGYCGMKLFLERKKK